MTLEEAIERYTNNAEYERTHGSLQGCMEFRQLAEWLKDYKRLLEQEPCEVEAAKLQQAYNKGFEDCRNTAIIQLSHNKTGDDDCDVIIQKDIETIKSLPSVASQQKMGHWIKMPLIEAGQTYSHECSLCGRRILITDIGLSEFPYCHCGAKMIEQ